jgi:hypothetical protein
MEDEIVAPVEEEPPKSKGKGKGKAVEQKPSAVDHSTHNHSKKPSSKKARVAAV